MNYKKLLIVLAVLVVTVLAVTLLCGFAPAESAEDTAAAPASPTFLERLRELFTYNGNTVLNTVSLVLEGAVLSIGIPLIKSKLTANTLSVKTSNAVVGEVVGAVNTMIERSDTTDAKTVSLENKVVQLETTIAQQAVFTRSILEILAIVYPNSKNVPQATKDLINMKYVEALKFAQIEPAKSTEAVISEEV